MHAFARPLNSWDIVKIIGLLLMAIDHAGFYLFPEHQWLRAIGRGAAPIFLFLAGYAASTRFKWDTLALAFLLACSHWSFEHKFLPFNILFSILACRLILHWLETHEKKIMRPYEWFIGAVILFGSLIVIEYGTIGMLFALCGYVQRHNYPMQMQKRLWALTLICHGMLESYFGDFTAPNIVLIAVTLAAVAYGLFRLNIKTAMTYWPKPIRHALKLISYYSGYIYVGNIILFEVARTL